MKSRHLGRELKEAREQDQPSGYLEEELKRPMEQQVQRPWCKDTYETQRISAYLVDLIILMTLTFLLWASEGSVKLALGAEIRFNPFFPPEYEKNYN